MGGHIQSPFPGPEKSSTQFLPTGLEPASHFLWPRLLWAPAHLPTATGFPPGSSEEQRVAVRKARAGLRKGARFPFGTITVRARAPPHRAGTHHPPMLGPGQGLAGCRGQSPHRQLCARSPTRLPQLAPEAGSRAVTHAPCAGTSFPAGAKRHGVVMVGLVLWLRGGGRELWIWVPPLTTPLSLAFPSRAKEAATKNGPCLQRWA